MKICTSHTHETALQHSNSHHKVCKKSFSVEYNFAFPILYCLGKLPLYAGTCFSGASQLLFPTPAIYVHTMASENPSRPVVSSSTHKGRHVVIIHGIRGN